MISSFAREHASTGRPPPPGEPQAPSSPCPRPDRPAPAPSPTQSADAPTARRGRALSLHPQRRRPGRTCLCTRAQFPAALPANARKHNSFPGVYSTLTQATHKFSPLKQNTAGHVLALVTEVRVGHSQECPEPSRGRAERGPGTAASLRTASRRRPLPAGACPQPRSRPHPGPGIPSAATPRAGRRPRPRAA